MLSTADHPPPSLCLLHQLVRQNLILPLLPQVYSPEKAPFAVLYFCSGMEFNRAIRHWANTSAHLARVHHIAATGFKLTDKGLFPRR